jgi:two-component system, NarL family, response regulator LiaR
MIRILLADDHPIVREGLRALLETQADFEIIAEAANGDEALRLTSELQPDIILLDLEMPLMDGVEAIRRLRGHSAELAEPQRHLVGGVSTPSGIYRHSSHTIHIIVFTAFDNDERIIDALQAGANGYLLKDAPREEIFNAIRVTMQGGSLLQPIVASKLLRHMGQHGLSPQQAVTRAPMQHQPTPVPTGASAYRGPSFEPLTERELEVLHLLAQGMPNKEIAAQLTISERTAKFHVSSIMGKLGATNRTEAVSLAAQRGLITLLGR